MAIDLTGTKIKDTYKQILHVDSGVNSSDKTVYDGDGTATALKVSTTDVQVNNSPVLTDADIGSTVQAYDADLTAWSGKTAPSGDVVGTSDTQTLTNKTISADNNTLSGVAPSSFVLSNASGNIDGTVAQKVIPSGVVVGTTDTQTLTNKTLTSPVVNTPTGITKTDVGLGNVDNTSDATKNSATATLTNKTINFSSNTLIGVQEELISNTNIKTVGGVSLLGSGDIPVGGVGDVTLNGTQTLTNKTIAFASNTLTDVASINTTQTLTNKTLTSPAITGGTINNTPIGATTPSTGSFTTLTVNGAAISSPLGLFRKANPDAVAFTKTGNGTATTASVIYVEVNGSILTIASSTSITMPTFVAGTDYAIWAKPDGTLEATSNHTSPPVANARKVGGFHYAPGGHSGSPGGGNTTPGIWAGSFWDLKFRPACPDPRGMEYFAGSWMDMYFTGVDAITNGSSKYNVTIADGSSPPKVPSMFGGNGSTTYGSYTWFEAMELATAFGKRCPTQQEFMAHAYGTTEASSIGTDQGSTVLNAAYTSASGLFQATGVMWIWGRDRGGPFAAASWNANTEGRGSEFNAPNAALFGGTWSDGSISGSRCSAWNTAASVSASIFGSRFVASHHQSD